MLYLIVSRSKEDFISNFFKIDLVQQNMSYDLRCEPRIQK